ncbi:SRPBCC domain-containing protein [Pseudaestuariivita atlantica]|uniref:Polyketide cyclase n=1 Tax=Pseudaestuariivita atlantica TaxID=1317121 RepID=A0A0L1JRN0_9RHOB|nr:SRPBCC domain-containing protein [Pseudaestuariivita atlantica]KNG94048.1 hypothetical protein ATO11_07285 [Pseudaestuariivita atlantica]
MRAFATSIDISAPPDRVWQVLTDAPTLAGGGFGILRIDGSIAQGQTFRLWSEVAPKRAFALTVVTMEAPRLMVWTSGMPFGLFRGTRRFNLSAHGSQTRFDMRETFTGPLAPLFGRAIPDLQPSFDTFAAALKRHAEGAHA